MEFAEQSGAIRSITGNVVAQAARWNAMDFVTPIAVSISVRDLQDETFPDFLKTALRSQNVKPEHMKLEITERALMENLGAAKRALRQLNNQGTRVSLDDYGTGYATFTHLSRLPVSELKIDYSFVTGITEGSRNFAIALTTSDLAHRLGMRTVAEGVETEAKLCVLQKTGCDEVQGYYFAQPMMVNLVPTWAQTRINKLSL